MNSLINRWIPAAFFLIEEADNIQYVDILIIEKPGLFAQDFVYSLKLYFIFALTFKFQVDMIFSEIQRITVGNIQKFVGEE